MLHLRPFVATLVIVTGALLSPTLGYSQSTTTAKPNWQNLDLETDSVFGVSTERAYKELLRSKKVTPVRVAVIDGGIDVTHPALRGSLWHHNKPNSNRDHEGYANDDWGWNFIGSSKGNVEYDNLELTRLLRRMRPKYEKISDTSALNAAEQDSLRLFRRMVADYNRQRMIAQQTLNNLRGFEQVLNAVVTKIGKPNPTREDFLQFKPTTQPEAQVAQSIARALTEESDFATLKAEQIDRGIEHFQKTLEYDLNFAFDPRYIVADDTTNAEERFYGNPDVIGPDAEHGTHVAGIIGASRDKSSVVKGVADAVEIIAVRVVPLGDERDKDVANGIRYAVDHGARIINMSFGKSYSNNKKVVDDAVKYAMSKDVLLIHAAGNDGKNLEGVETYPNPTYADGSGSAEAWIEVGAIGWKNDETLVAPFSNYGQTRVDVFAPGVRINSTVPDGKYKENDGTSMAAPVVTGVAALIRSRYPNLTAVQVKEIIMKSVTKVNHDVIVREGGQPKRVPFSSLSVSGGVVNAYNALKLAEEYAKQK
jgi:subtilisin family serine protease